MANSCVLIPKVRNKNGELQESQLFKELTKFTDNRDEAYILYQVTRTPYFKQNWNPKLQLDSNNEPTLNSLLTKTNIADKLGQVKVLTKLNEAIGGWNKSVNKKKLYLYNQENSSLLTERCIAFNKSEYSSKYVATVNKVQDSESNRVFLSPTITVRNNDNSSEATQMTYNHILNNKIRDILSKWGIGVGELTSLEESRSLAGITDFSVAQDAANGLINIIRISKEEVGEAVLPEEFAHFLIRSMRDSPLVTRLLNIIKTNNLAPQVLGDSYEKYQAAYIGKEDLLVEEAAGHLVADYINKNPIPEGPHISILQRLVNKIKSLFGSYDANDIVKAMMDANQQVSQLTSMAFSGDLRPVNIEMASDDQLYAFKDKVDNDEVIAKSILNRELKRYKIYENRHPGGVFNVAQAEKIRKLEESIEDHKAVEGIHSFLSDAVNTMTALNTRLRELNSDKTATIQQKSALLRDVRNYIFSYSSSVDDIRQAIINDEDNSDTKYNQAIKDDLDKATALLNDALDRYKRSAKSLFLSFIKPFMGSNIEIPFGKFKGKTYTVEELIESADKDISMLDRWVDSMSNSSDYMLKMFDQAVKLSKENRRLKVLDISKQIVAAAQKLRSSGVENFDWMFEKDNKGELTGNYIDNINWGLLKQNKKEFFDKLTEKYGKNPIGQKANEYRSAIANWYAHNYEEVNGQRFPKESIYKNNAFYRMTNEQKAFYNTFTGILNELKGQLPDDLFTNKNQAIQIRKDFMERMLSSGSLTGMFDAYKNNLKDQLLDRSDDDEFGVKTDMEDFEGKKVRTVPTYYTKKIKDTKSLSTDVVSTLIAFADMATNYNEMNKIIDTLEIGRDLMKDREIQDTRGGKPLIEKINTLGRSVSTKLNKGESNFMARLNDFFDMQVYGIYMKDEGKILGLNSAKAANFINKISALNGLALNLLSGVATVAHDITQINAEAISKQFFSVSQLAKADRDYAKGLADSMEDIGSKSKTGKLNLFLEKFNVLQEYEEHTRDAEYDKGKFARLMSTKSLYFMMHAGDHWGQSRIALAVANNYKMKAPDGKIVGLYDAMEVKYIDDSHHNYGGNIEVKPGYTKEDDTQFTKEDLINFSKKVTAVNERLFGIYNKADRNALQTLGLGRMAMMYRKYLIPSMERRFSQATYNMDLKDYTEGYYRTTGRFLHQLYSDVKEGKMIWATRFNDMTDTEKSNIKRAMVEVSQWLALSITIALMNMGPKDKNKQVWYKRWLEYHAQRLKTDVGSLTPTPGMLSDLWKILKSPAAGMQTMEDIGNMINVVNPIDWVTPVKNGRFKGHSVALKSLLQSPLFPTSKTIYRALHPESAVASYK